MIKFILGIFFFFTGICIGFWFGVERVYFAEETIPTKTTFDMLSIIASWIGSVGTVLALLFAMFAFSKWRHQVIENKIIEAGVDILKANIAVKNDLSVLICNFSNEIVKDKLIDKLKMNINDLETKVEILYTLTHGKEDRVLWASSEYFKVDDFLKETKEFLDIARSLSMIFSNGTAKFIDENIEIGFAYKAMSNLKIVVDNINISEDPLNVIIPICELNSKINIILKNANSKIAHWL
ncbi:hypothetical protein LO82_22345 [Vibrio vulnificus]|uniref:hypothetical protein n=1 Tax=Vibrio vulnificus TaxID=672 RepID=UPI0006AD2E5E|nr:hypothetical protein [Vibrio vulnificus]KOR93645.1 hypothetical protein LO82_22345 [Vibrio vulnificus]HDY8067597.1 hypothetical protein [Vibrio vulnificus]